MHWAVMSPRAMRCWVLQDNSADWHATTTHVRRRFRSNCGETRFTAGMKHSIMTHWCSDVPLALGITAKCSEHIGAEVAELADATDLKSVRPRGLCGFDPRPRQVQVSLCGCSPRATARMHGYAIRGNKTTDVFGNLLPTVTFGSQFPQL